MRPYSEEARAFVRRVDLRETHSDPDWENLTYGDCCRNPRAAALGRVIENDVLLFWCLLWRNTGRRWEDFTGERGWYFIGALRVQEALDEGQAPKDAKHMGSIARAERNVHCFCGRRLDKDNRVFIGNIRLSRLFPRAVDLEVRNPSGLMFQTIRTAGGKVLKLKGKGSWPGSTRPCRVIWDLDYSEQRERAIIARDTILEQTGYDLLKGLITD